MPITPISSDSNNNRASIVSNMLNRGGRSLSQLLGSAIQLGRNTADNQLRQEQAFLTEQRREINLNQRRAENLRQDFEDDRRFGEEKRRFDLKFEQDDEVSDERFRQQELDRDVRRQQVTGGLALGAERNDISRTNSATSVFNAETSRMNAKTNAASVASRDKALQLELGQKAATAQSEAQEQQARDQFTSGFDKLSPEEKRKQFFEKGLSLGFDASTRRLLAAEAGVGVSSEKVNALDALPADRRAQAEGLVDSIEELEKQRAIGTKTTNPATGASEFQRLPAEEFNKRRRELELELDKILKGSRGTADGIFDKIGKKLGL